MTRGYRDVMLCSHCGAESYTDRVKPEVMARQKRKRVKLVGMLYFGWLVLMILSLIISPYITLAMAVVGGIASFIGLVSYVVSQWDTL